MYKVGQDVIVSHVNGDERVCKIAFISVKADGTKLYVTEHNGVFHGVWFHSSIKPYIRPIVKGCFVSYKDKHAGDRKGEKYEVLLESGDDFVTCSNGKLQIRIKHLYNVVD